MRSILRILILLCSLGAASLSWAQAWPPATVKIVVPYPPGTEPDVLARDLANQLARKTGKNFVVDNKPGANAIIGTSEVAAADGDGATLLMVDRLAIVTNPLLYSKMPYKWEDSIKPVSDLARVNLFVAVRANFPAQTYKEFLAYAKANKDKVNVGTGGNGHVNHIGMAMIGQAEDVHFTYVPYKGVGPAVAGLMTGEVDAVMAGGLALQPHHLAKKLRVLVSGDDARAPYLADVPHLTEAGGKTGSIPSTVFALMAPGKTPDAVVAQISRAVGEIMGVAELRKSYEARGLQVAPTSPAQTLEQMKKEAASYERIIRVTGIKIE